MRVTREQKIERLTAFKNRAEHLAADPALVAYFEAAVKSAQSFDKQKELCELRQAALTGAVNSRAQQEYFELVTTQLNNMVMVGANGLTFFNQITVRNGQTPVFRKSADSETMLRITGPDGGWQTRRLDASSEAHQVTPVNIASDLIEHMVMDYDTGDQTVAHNTHMFRVQESMERKIDRVCWGRIVACTTGPDFKYRDTEADPIQRTIDFHSDVDVANLPATNKLVAAGNGAGTLMRKAVFDKFIKYLGGFSGLKGDLEGMRLGTIFVPSGHVNDWIEQVDVSSEDNAVTKQIFENGFLINLGGYTFNIVGEPTLSYSDGVCYGNTSRPIGNFYHYVDRDVVLDETTTKHRAGNMARYGVSKWYASVCPEYWRPGAVSGKFKD